MTGPNNPPPPGGPGRAYATPLTEEQRVLNYLLQSGGRPRRPPRRPDLISPAGSIDTPVVSSRPGLTA